MPSWNIHLAHAERLLREEGAAALGIGDVNCFLFGNLVPDIYVGYMVPGITKTVPYRITHVADKHVVPIPKEREFWDAYVVDAGGRRIASDLTLGAWAHLACDATYNGAVRAWFDERGITPGEEQRVGKQGDFAVYGRTLEVHTRPVVTDELLRECKLFSQYSIEEPDVRATIRVADDIIQTNEQKHLDHVWRFRLLDEEFFATTRERANSLMVERLAGLARMSNKE